MTRTPDEIKKGLECCSQVGRCMHGCPYYISHNVPSCTLHKSRDALALIQQLQADNAEKDQKIRQLETQNAELLTKVEQLQAERDAAVKSLRGRCFECKNNKTSVCLICSKDKALKYWEWRGVQKENEP